jgi:hypothetical protein
MPHAVHEIDANPPAATINTDPWVFHPGFVWSICRHNSLRKEVKPGDIVLFGSSTGGKWILDTGLLGKIGGVYDRMVLPTILHTFYPFVGKSYGDAIDRYSFTPAIRADDCHKPFQRPSINRLFSYLRKLTDGRPPSPNNAQALVFCKCECSVVSFWNSIVQLVEQEGLVLGTAFNHPATPQDIPITQYGGSKCSREDDSRAKSCSVCVKPPC